jgi:signal transduction histidine kinase
MPLNSPQMVYFLLLLSRLINSKMLSFSTMYKSIKYIAVFLVLSFPLQFLNAQTPKSDYILARKLIASAYESTDTNVIFGNARQALALAQKYNDPHLTYESYFCLAFTKSNNSDELEANQFYLKAYEADKILSDSERKGLYYAISYSYYFIPDYEQMRQFAEKLLQLAIKTNDSKAELKSYDLLGSIYGDVENFDKALQYSMKSVDLSLKIKDTSAICGAYRTLANLYLDSKNITLALTTMDKCMQYAHHLSDSNPMKLEAYLDNGDFLLESEQYEKAILACELALKLIEKGKNSQEVARIYKTLISTYTQLGHFEKTESYVKLCSSIKLGEWDLMNYQNTLGNLYYKEQKIKEAIICFKKSAELTIKFKDNILLQKNYLLLSDSYEKIGEPQLSLNYLRKSNIVQDSILSGQKAKKIIDAQFRYNLAKSEDEVKKIKENQKVIFTIGVLAIALLTIIFLLYFSYVKVKKNKEIKNTNRKLKESNEILRQFAFASAHDLKEPLRSINSFLNLLQRRYLKNLPEEANEYISFVLVGVKRMENLTNALLEYSSIFTLDSISDKNNDIAVVLHEIFENQIDLIESKKAVITYPTLLPKICMNEAYLKLLLTNLTNNALKFSKETAKIDIGFKVEASEIIFYVKDDGIGIDPSYNDKIYKLFQRLDRKTNQDSTGIGLTICKNIVDKYLGRIWFESVVNEGTTFFVAFPKSMVSDAPTEYLQMCYKFSNKEEKDSLETTRS